MIRHFQGRIEDYEIHINNEQINIINAGHHISLIYNARNLYPSFECTYNDDEHIIIGTFRTRQVELQTLYSASEEFAEIILKPIGSIYSYAHIVNVPVNYIKGIHQLGMGRIPEHTDARMYYCCLSHGDAEFSDSGYSSSEE